MFAAMRTGSNFLEANLNALPGVTCHGEVFNPHFMGKKDATSLFGIDIASGKARQIVAGGSVGAFEVGADGTLVYAMNSMRSFFSKAYAPVDAIGLGTRTPYSNISSR